jgi:hypothetical protein
MEQNDRQVHLSEDIEEEVANTSNGILDCPENQPRCKDDSSAKRLQAEYAVEAV